METNEKVSSGKQDFSTKLKILNAHYYKINDSLKIDIIENGVVEDFVKTMFEDSIKKALNIDDIAINFKYNSPVETFEFYYGEIEEFLKQYSCIVSQDDVSVDFGEKITILIMQSKEEWDRLNLLSFTDGLKKHLNRYTFKEVEVLNKYKIVEETSNDENQNIDILESRNMILSDGIDMEIEEKYYNIRGLDIITGKNFTDEILFLDKIYGEMETVQVAGVIRYFQERTFLKKVANENGETQEEKVFYTFELFDGHGKIRASYFPTKAYLEQEKKIGNGQIVTICGKIELYNESLNLKVKEIAYCCLPENQLPNESAVPDVVANEEPEIEIDEADYKTEPENYFITFPCDYCEEEQTDMFSAFSTKKIASRLQDKDFVVFDLETTGLDCKVDEILEIGAVKIRNGVIIETFNTLCKPKKAISEFITNLTGISDDMVADAPKFADVVGDFYKFTRNSTVVAHNAEFDTTFLRHHAKKCYYNFDNDVLDTLLMSRKFVSGVKNHKLGTLAKYFDIVLDNAHRALFDTIATAKLFIKLCEIEDSLKDKE